jgi:glycosyltransferase involved in cell wall biosynthesis
MTRDHGVVAVSTYPLSEDVASRLSAELGEEVELLDISTLRRLPAGRLLRRLRDFRGRPFALVLEDEASEALLPILTLVGVAAGASSLVRVGHEGEPAPIRKGDVIPAVSAFLAASLQARRAARRTRVRTAELLAAPPPRRRLSGLSRVLYLNANLWFGLKAGGSVGHVAGVVNALARRGVGVDVAAVAPQPLVDEGVGFVPLAPPRRFGFPAELNQYRFAEEAEAQLLGRGRDGYDLVYQRLSLGSTLGADLARAWDVPLVVEYNGSEVWAARNWGRPLADEALARAAESALLHQADVIVVVSDALAAELEERGLEPGKVVVHPNGVDPDRFDPGRLREAAAATRADVGIPQGALVASFLGTFGKWHGVDVLAHAVRALHDDHAWIEEHDLHFLLVGDGLQLPLLRELLSPFLGERVHLTGLVPQEDAPRFLAAADVVVSPHVPNQDGSRFFGSPTKLFEYMAMGLAIVASDLEQIGEVLRPALRAADRSVQASADDVAILATPGSVDELVAGIKRLVEDPSLRATLGANARALALARYTWDAHVEAILAKLDEVCGAR